MGPLTDGFKYISLQVLHKNYATCDKSILTEHMARLPVVFECSEEQAPQNMQHMPANFKSRNSQSSQSNASIFNAVPKYHMYSAVIYSA
jgi:hypothetical protein